MTSDAGKSCPDHGTRRATAQAAAIVAMVAELAAQIGDASAAAPPDDDAAAIVHETDLLSSDFFGQLAALPPLVAVTVCEARWLSEAARSPMTAVTSTHPSRLESAERLTESIAAAF